MWMTYVEFRGLAALDGVEGQVRHGKQSEKHQDHQHRQCNAPLRLAREKLRDVITTTPRGMETMVCNIQAALKSIIKINFESDEF